MKKRMGLLLSVIAIVLVLVLGALFWNPILDALPIDQSRWHESNGSTYYYNSKGDMITGWLEQDGNRYYFGADGAMVTGWAELSDGRYYLSGNGVMHTGWLAFDGKHYYLNSDGRMRTGWLEEDDTVYYFDSDGSLHTGWLTTGSGRYFTDENGILQTGWLEQDGSQYYLGADGAVVTGWLELEDNRYYLNGDGAMVTGWLELEDGRYYLNEDGTMAVGWLETEGGRFYLGPDGRQGTGWQTIDGIRYYLQQDGTSAAGWMQTEEGRYYFNGDSSIYTGWLEENGQKYYLTETGTVSGKQIIDGETFYFSSTGINILLVNRWNALSSDYVPDDLVLAECGAEMTAEAAAALDAMLRDCRAAGFYPQIRSGYRNYSVQQALLNNKVAEGYSYGEAIQIVAIPGTSEHQTGLAVDIADSTYTLLNARQGETAIQGWLHEHCWEYGFIVRYPVGTTAITGIIYEPWHYRYVGVELAKELTESGLCLEEYLDALTNDGTTCGDPNSLS